MLRAMKPATILMAAASGSGSGSGTAMAGGFAAYGSAADPRSSSLKQRRFPGKPAVFPGYRKKWPEKAFFFSPVAQGDVTSPGSTVGRLLARRPASEHGILSYLNPGA